MSKTLHIQKRMSQRGITNDLLNLTLAFGTKTGSDRYILNRKGCQNLIDSLRHVEKIAIKAIDKGGLVVIKEGDSLITTYNLNYFVSYSCLTGTIHS